MAEEMLFPTEYDFGDTSYKLPVGICLDIGDGAKRKDIFEALHELQNTLSSNAAANLSAIIAVAEFNGSCPLGFVKCAEADIEKMYELSATRGATASGLVSLMDKADGHIRLGKELGLACFRPVLLVITDGASADKAQDLSVVEAKKKLYEKSQRGKRTVVTVSYEIADGRDAEELFRSANVLIDGMSVYQPIQISSLKKLKEFFARTGREIIEFAEGKTPEFRYTDLLAWDEF